MIVALSINAFSQIPTNGLVGYWPFSGNANDASGNGNNGVVSGATLTNDRFGNPNSAYSFNGLTNIIKVSGLSSAMHLNAYSGSFSVVLWVKASTQTTSSRIFEHDDNNSGWPFSFMVSGTPYTSVSLNSYDGTNNPMATVTNVLDNNWHMVTLIVNHTTDSLYGFLDNTLQAQVLNTLTSGNSLSDTLSIGNRRNLNRGLNGLIDDIRVYNRVLSKSEVNIIFNEVITGVNFINDQNKINIYPNPTKDFINIDCGNYSNLTGNSIKIINALGQIVLSTSINQQQSIIDLSNIKSKGLYFIQVSNSQSNIITERKIILQ